MNPDHPISKYRLERIKEAIKDRAMNKHEIGALIGLSPRWVPPYMTYLCEKNEAHIEGWPPYGEHAYPVAAYRGGPGKNAPAPPSVTPNQRKANYRRRVLADPERRDLFRSKDRARKRKPKRMDVVAAFFGPT